MKVTTWIFPIKTEERENKDIFETEKGCEMTRKPSFNKLITAHFESTPKNNLNLT